MNNLFGDDKETQDFIMAVLSADSKWPCANFDTVKFHEDFDVLMRMICKDSNHDNEQERR